MVDKEWGVSVGTFVFGKYSRGMQITCKDGNGEVKYVAFPFKLFEKMVKAYKHLNAENRVFNGIVN